MTLITHVFVVLALLISTHVDIKKREVPDWISFSTIILGFAISLFVCAAEHSLWPLLHAVGGFAVGLLIGLLMYFTGQWGGGDAKLLMGLGALFGATTFFWYFLLALLVAGAVYGLAYGLVLAIIRRDQFLQAYRSFAYQKLFLRLRIIVLLVFLVTWLYAFFFIDSSVERLSLMILGAGVFLLLHAWGFAKALEEGCMKKQVPLSDLVEGDWVLEDIHVTVGGKKVTVVPEKFGITREQITKVKHSKKKVWVKEGIPFVPSFLIAYFLTVVFIFLM